MCTYVCVCESCLRLKFFRRAGSCVVCSLCVCVYLFAFVCVCVLSVSA